MSITMKTTADHHKCLVNNSLCKFNSILNSSHNLTPKIFQDINIIIICNLTGLFLKKEIQLWEVRQILVTEHRVKLLHKWLIRSFREQRQAKLFKMIKITQVLEWAQTCIATTQVWTTIKTYRFAAMSTVIFKTKIMRVHNWDLRGKNLREILVLAQCLVTIWKECSWSKEWPWFHNRL